MLNRFCRAMLTVTLLCATCATLAREAAPTPPMGWNSWDSYGLTLDEADFKANARELSKLRSYGWTYAVIDEGWYMGNPFGDKLQSRQYFLDSHGLLIPAPARFPSSSRHSRVQAAGRLGACPGAEVWSAHRPRHPQAGTGDQPPHCWILLSRG